MNYKIVREQKMNLKFYRTKRNLSIPQLSFLSSVPVETIEDIEKRGSYKLDTAKQLAKALNVNLYDLISERYNNIQFAGVDLTDVLNAIIPLIKPEDYEQFVFDINTDQHGISIKSMDKAYQIYEDFCLGKIEDYPHIHWEKTEKQW